MSKMLELKSVNYSFGENFSLENISFEVHQGECLGIIGESGCGKTTLLKLIFGKIEPEKGEVLWNGKKVPGPSEQLILGHEDFKYVTQDFELMPFTSVLENIIKPLSRQFMDENIQKARTLLKVVDLEEFEDRKVKNLSGGQKQRVALAQALAKKPKLLLLDEPFSHVDNFLKNKLRRNLFEFLKTEHITCIVVSHDTADVIPFSNKILVLKKGKVIKISNPQELYRSPEFAYVAGLFGDFNHLNSKLIFDSGEKSKKLIVYPEDIKAIQDRNGDALVTHQYFSGSYYAILFNWKNQSLIIHSKIPLDPEVKYNLKFNRDIILRRNED
jgi:ABC-type Fe3+/spermidine/putrescine transport system ATPase subunit